MQRRKLLGRLILFALFTTTLLGTIAAPMSRLVPITHAAPATPETAQSADSFVDSIGVATHWGYPDTPYGGNYEGVKEKLAALGLRHVRDGINSRAQDLAKLGIKTTVVVGPGPMGTPTQIRDAIKAANTPIAAIEAVEGPNEPDLFWPANNTSYGGQGFPQGVIAFQKDLYTALNSDPATASLTVIGPALGKSYDYNTKSPLGNGTLTNYVNWGNFHPYPGGGNAYSFPFSYDTIDKYYWHGNFPSVNIDEWPYAFDIWAPPFSTKPMAATETGYQTSKNSISEKAHGKYMPRLFLEYFRKGIVRTFCYELVDEFNDPNNPEANFGLLHNDLTPKPAYIALKNLINLLNDPGPSFTPSSLDYTLAVNPPASYGRTQYIHHLLLQKRDGTFYLVLWHEIANADTTNSPPREIAPPDMPVTLTLKVPLSATVYALDDGGNMSSTSMSASALSLNVSDKVTIVKLPSSS